MAGENGCSPAKKRRGSATWARLIAKVFHADPLTCRPWRGQAQDRGLRPPEDPKPPPTVPELVPVDEEGREIAAA